MYICDEFYAENIVAAKSATHSRMHKAFVGATQKKKKKLSPM